MHPGALAERGGKKIVFVVKDDRVRAVEVSTGRTIGELVELRGVKAGERLVLNPGEKLKDGVAVALVKK